MGTHLRRATNTDTAQLLDWLRINSSEITSSSLHWLITCLFKASSVSSLRSLLAVIASFPNSGTPNSFSILRKNFLTSQDKYARSPESNLIPTALYLHGTSWRLSNEWQLCDSLEMMSFLREWTWGYWETSSSQRYDSLSSLLSFKVLLPEIRNIINFLDSNKIVV